MKLDFMDVTVQSNRRGTKEVCFPVTVFSWVITRFSVEVEAYTNIE
jgi:hypothetical protein